MKKKKVLKSLLPIVLACAAILLFVGAGTPTSEQPAGKFRDVPLSWILDLEDQFKRPENERLFRVPELDSKQRMYRKLGGKGMNS